MDKKLLKQRIASLKQIRSLGGKKKKIDFMKQCQEKCIDAICEGCFNIVRGGVKLTPKQLKKAAEYKLDIRRLGDPKTTLKTRREILMQKGSGLLTLIPSLILPLLMSVLKR